MTASAPVAPPRWPADAALLREVFRAARTEGWRRRQVSRGGVHRYWIWAEGADRSVLVVHHNGAPDAQAGLQGGGMDLQATVRRLPYLVDLLVDCGWLPEHFHRKFATGRSEGRDDIQVGLREAAEFGEVPNHSAELLREPLGYAQSYWLSVLRQRTAELDRPLDALLDRAPFPRRRQLDAIVTAVTELLEAKP